MKPDAGVCKLLSVHIQNTPSMMETLNLYGTISPCHDDGHWYAYKHDIVLINDLTRYSWEHWFIFE